MTLTVEEAAINLGAFIEKAAQNREEIVLTHNSNAIATLRPHVLSVSFLPTAPRKRTPGTAKGLVTIAADFDAPLADFADYE